MWKVNVEVRIRLPQLHPAQVSIQQSQARFKVLVCGRRFGKTTIALDSLCSVLLKGQSAAYFAPTYRMGAEVWREAKRVLAPLIRDWNEHEWRMELATGGVLECWSLANGSAETVRGRKYHLVVMDEAALFDSAEVWHGAIRPLLTDYAGRALFASTPRGRNWFWQLYLQGLNPDWPEWEVWQFPTGANPHIAETEIEAARQGMPERFFRQEYEAVFLDDGGVVFRNVDRVCVGVPSHEYRVPRGEAEEVLGAEYRVPRGEAEEVLGAEYRVPSGEAEEASRFQWPTRGGRRFDAYGRPIQETEADRSIYGDSCFFGVDWGKDNDFTCVSVMTREGRQIHLERFNQIGWAVQRGRLAALYEQFKPRIILAEENSIGSVNIEALQEEGLPVQGFMTTAKSKTPLIDELALAIEKEEVALLNDATLKHELMAYEMKRTSMGWSYGAAPGGHDDTVMATALSLWASRRYGGAIISFA
jgi:Terminase large subunit, T4likevirus-type, N-terminal/Terminase RNaseH-like domain